MFPGTFVSTQRSMRIILITYCTMSCLDGVALQNDSRGSTEGARMRFDQSLALLRLKDAYEAAISLNDVDAWKVLIKAALYYLDIDMAVRVCRHVGNAGMVITLEKMAGIEDKNLLAGHVASLDPSVTLTARDFNMAQELFLKSSRPYAALEMRMDLKDWDMALRLAQQLNTSCGTASLMPEISQKHAISLEIQTQYAEALKYYEQALSYPSRGVSQDSICQAGMTRCTLRLGDIRRGKRMAIE